MPKITGGLADISTEQRVATPGVYNVKIENVEFTKSKNNIPMFVTTTVITDDEDEQGNSVKGIMMTERFTTLQKDGQRNEAGLRAFKKVILQCLGEDRANDPDFDSDELIGWTGQAQIKVEDYESNDIDMDTGSKIMKQTNRVQKYHAG